MRGKGMRGKRMREKGVRGGAGARGSGCEGERVRGGEGGRGRSHTWGGTVIADVAFAGDGDLAKKRHLVIASLHSSVHHTIWAG
jgi:hypothetical protein